MILSEIKKIGLPVIGLVNSHCHLEIEYPIFAQDQNFSSVHFFCYFLATLVAKETVYTQHKRYTKSRSVRVKHRRIKQQKLPIVSKISFQNLVTQQKIKKY
jgi:ribosomal protein S2